MNHGINGNMSLDRRIELTPQHNYDSTIGSDKSSSHSKSETGVYEVNNDTTKSNIQQSNVVNNNFINSDGRTIDSSTLESKRLKWPTDKAYYLAKELLMTERTYKKDLDILNTIFQWFRNELQPEDIANLEPLFRFMKTMVTHHEEFLQDLEQRLLLWETSGNIAFHRIGDIMLKGRAMLSIYQEYIENHFSIMEQIHELYETNDQFQQIYKDFEQQKICYIPIGYLILKPLHRVLHYHLILERLVDFYAEDHEDRPDCQAALENISQTSEILRETLPNSENYELLFELQRDLSGFDKLVQSDRVLIRQGCLLKHSKKGLQQRMFFLFSDVLLYGNKSPVNQTFKILGHVPIRSLLTENSEHNAFVIYGGQRSITVSAGTPAEKTLWLAELSKASSDIKSKPHAQLSISSLKNCSSSEEGLETLGINSSTLSNKTPTSRGNTATHVCWHRGATVGLRDHLVSAENQFAGYLLRKFKNSSGWQKLWVVFTSFCLFFYKNYQDDYALASLPLLGYSVGPPQFNDTIQKEFVFKLSFKNHIYFFRAESEHTFRRWLEVLSSTTQTQDFKHISK